MARGRVVASAIEWPTLALIVACYALWFFAGHLYAHAPLLAVPLLAITIVLHSSLQHEAIHRHPTHNAGLNEILVWLPLGLLVPYRRYRQQHLQHHNDSRLTDPYDDPESYYLARTDWQRLPYVWRTVLAWNNMLLVRVLIGPALTTVVFLKAEAKALFRPADRHRARQVRIAWVLHAIGLAALGLIVHFVFAMPPAVYLLAAYLGLSLLAIRSFCEHQWAEEPEGRTVIVEHSLLGILFLNNNLHLVHHTHPGLPWYALPSAYRTRRDEWRTINGGYVFHGYSAVARSFGLRAKEPVPHPVRAGR
jgi:fatty acid desaturase